MRPPANNGSWETEAIRRIAPEELNPAKSHVGEPGSHPAQTRAVFIPANSSAQS